MALYEFVDSKIYDQSTPYIYFTEAENKIIDIPDLGTYKISIDPSKKYILYDCCYSVIYCSVVDDYQGISYYERSMSYKQLTNAFYNYIIIEPTNESNCYLEISFS